MTSSTGKQVITDYILPNMPRSKSNEMWLVYRIKHEKYFSSKTMQKVR